MAKKKQHGGKRKGAGRKAGPEGRAVVLAASVPSELVEQLDSLAKKRGWNRSQAVTEAIRGLLDAEHGR
jgi:Ribbon-helix-helix protein, copG family